MSAAEVAILDLWTDANRGDNALQRGLIELLRSRHPDARIAGVFRFGTNEIELAGPEIGPTSACLDVVHGGVRRTYYSEANSGRFRGVVHQVVSVLSFLEALVVTLTFRLLGPRSRPLVGAARYASLQVIRDADVVIWKGKNFRDYRGATSVTRALTLTGAAWFASLLRRQLDCVNASFWSIEGRAQRMIYRQAFRRCATVTVRDAESVAHARALLGPAPRIVQCADLSFGLVADLASRIERPDPGRWDVALTVTAWGDAGEQQAYVDALDAALRRLASLGAARFVVVPQVTRASEDAAPLVAELDRRVRALPHGATLDVLPGAPAIADLLDTYAGCRVLLGTRMHSCVFARAVGTPFVAVAYDAGPKWDVLAEFWETALIHRYGSPGSDLADACERVWSEGGALLRASEAGWQACIDGSRRNITVLDG